MAGKEDFDPSTLNLWLPSPPSSSLISAETRIDWKETPEAHVFKADLPGFRIEEVRVEIEDGRVLQISGERNVEKLDENETWHRVERSSRKFMRRFQLPENANLEQLKAAVENGVLTVTVSRQDVKTPSIEISSVKDSPAKLIYLPCGCVERELNPEDSPFSEEEIRDVLLASLTPLTIKDLLAIFKPRLNTREDMQYFVDALSKISNLQKSSGSDYVVLKEVFVVPISDSNC